MVAIGVMINPECNAATRLDGFCLSSGLFVSGGAGFAAGVAFYFFFGEHGASAFWGAAVAVAVVGVGVVEVVFVEEFFVWGDVAEGADEDSAVAGFGLAVGGAGVVDEHGGSEAVDDVGGVFDAEEVGDGAVGIALVG